MVQPLQKIQVVKLTLHWPAHSDNTDRLLWITIPILDLVSLSGPLPPLYHYETEVELGDNLDTVIMISLDIPVSCETGSCPTMHVVYLEGVCSKYEWTYCAYHSMGN